MNASEIIAHDGRVYHLGLAPDELAENLFIVGDPARATRVASYFDKVLYEISNREYRTYTGVYKCKPVSVIGTGIGTDNVEIALVEAYILNEFDLETKIRRQTAKPMTVIRIGTSGGVQADVNAGTMAIAAYGLGLDSTGFYYEVEVPDETAAAIEEAAAGLIAGSVAKDSRFRNSFKPYVSRASEVIVRALEFAAAAKDVGCATGITVSSPGFYGPSSRFIDGLSNTVPSIKMDLARLNVGGLKVLNMEMESSLLFHIATAIGYRAGTICPIISNPLSSDDLIDYDLVVGHAIEIGLDAMDAVTSRREKL
jgi:uridine phosphorylase